MAFNAGQSLGWNVALKTGLLSRFMEYTKVYR